jgi:hypothetical protein
MELLSYINKAKTYSIAYLITKRAIIECCSKEEFMELINKINNTTYISTLKNAVTWNYYHNKPEYKGSIALLFNGNRIEHCYVDWYKENYEESTIHKYRDIIVTI